jgi:hypothetical protein
MPERCLLMASQSSQRRVTCKPFFTGDSLELVFLSTVREADYTGKWTRFDGQ